jgi:hypothetical protein
MEVVLMVVEFGGFSSSVPSTKGFNGGSRYAFIKLLFRDREEQQRTSVAGNLVPTLIFREQFYV